MPAPARHLHNEAMKTASLQTVRRHQAELRRCRRCPDMKGPPVTGNPVTSRILLIGQAPGSREIVEARPFAWTAGKTLFGWFERIGMDEDTFRRSVYMAAVCRCFPGKNPTGGDRVPRQDEIDNCDDWLDREVQMLQPRLVIPTGKLAIGRLLPVPRLDAVVGKRHTATLHGLAVDVVPLPHPSGASTWHRTEPGKTLLSQALDAIARHPAWRAACKS